ncbi:helix-turn-helix transcriptional regulator [Pedobacter sp. Leaf176]|uniref:helix-turn-helix transcriptional regulator n=1 Tax=Pedobacter sp. Leaf176 TaxID=1736286 RepID=UPI0006F271C0|nr:AraC family transcriptional regulator [Pedobacter sp. Leaf176]KQR67571.1 hypothetical protein ASF92_17985 [Pedobacter sp. Leaf176]
MRIRLSDYRSGKLLLESIYPDDFDTGLFVEERACQIDNGTFTIWLNEKWFNGTYIGFSKVKSEIPVEIYVENSDEQVFFLFCLTGEMKFRNISQQEVITLTGNQQYIGSGVFNNLIVRLSNNTEYLCLQLSRQHYKNLTGEEFYNDIAIYNSVSIDPEVRLVLNLMISQKNHKRVERISIEAKVYELLAFYINKAAIESTSSLKKHDIDKILLAKKLVEENIQTPNSLMELSRRVGINDYKLKIGFKELTGYTVFGYLNKVRMESAYNYLLKEKKTVNEVAFLVGYKNAQHFTVAFRKMYNILPGSINRGRLEPEKF